MHRKIFVCDNIQCDSKAEDDFHSATAIISNGNCDRHNEILLPEGCDMSEFRKNPVVLGFHAHSSWPVGKALWTKYDENRDCIVSKCRFAGTAEGRKAFELVRDKVLTAISVGLDYDEKEDVYQPTAEEKKKFPKVKRVIARWKLLEWSFVNVPANPEARVLDVKSLDSKTITVADARRPIRVESFTAPGQDEKTYVDRELFEINVLGRV